MHLFEETESAAGGYPDSRNFPFLSFWVRGESGSEDAEVRMADPQWLARDDSKPAGLITRYRGGPITRTWSEVVVPCGDFHLASPLLAVFVLSFPPGSHGVLQVDDVALMPNADSSIPMSISNGSTTGDARPARRATWLWETDMALATAESRAATIADLVRRGINVVFLQFGYQTSGPDDAPVFHLNRPAELRAFLRCAHSAGIDIQALDGYPEFALREMRVRLLGLVEMILAFNRQSGNAERFDGIHLDVEPYQLLGFDSPLRESLLVEFLELQQAIRAALEKEQSPPLYLADIPFWFHQEKISFGGIEQDATRHVLAFADNIAIMAYRRTPTGDDSIASTSVKSLKAAADAHKRIWIGVETERVEDSHIFAVCTLTETGWRAAANLSWPLLRKSNIDGFSLRSRNEGGTRSIGLAANTRRDDGSFEKALKSLASECRRWPGPANEMTELTPAREIVESAETKISFAGRTLGEFEGALSEVVQEVGSGPGFEGMAIHSYSSFQKLRERK